MKNNPSIHHQTRVIPSRADGEGPLKRLNRLRETSGVLAGSRVNLFWVTQTATVRSLAV